MTKKPNKRNKKIDDQQQRDIETILKRIELEEKLINIIKDKLNEFIKLNDGFISSTIH